MSFLEGDHRSDFQVRCPYNPSHQMPQSRLLFHISKGCKDKNGKAHLFDHCPYNFLHIIRREEVDRHLVNCKSKPQGLDLKEQKESQEQLQQAINAQFSRPKPQEEIIEEIKQHNEGIPGMQAINSMKTKKKRVRHRKNQIEEVNNEEEEQIPEWGAQFKESNQEESNIQDNSLMILPQMSQLNIDDSLNNILKDVFSVQKDDDDDDDGFTYVSNKKPTIQRNVRKNLEDSQDDQSFVSGRRNQKRNK